MKKDLELNRDKILKLIGLFDEAMTELSLLKTEPKEKIITTRDKYVLEQLFYRIAMISIDLCFHITASLCGKVPDTYKGCFKILAENRIISPELEKKLGQLASLRNLIAHVYWDLDYEKLYNYLNHLDTLNAFKKSILKLIQ